MRRRRTGVPEDTPFRIKPQLALDMLGELAAEGSLPLHLATCDDDFSVNHAIEEGVADLGLSYLAEVARNTHVWTARPVFSAPSQAVDTVTNELPPAVWRPFVLREGSQVP